MDKYFHFAGHNKSRDEVGQPAGSARRHHVGCLWTGDARHEPTWATPRGRVTRPRDPHSNNVFTLAQESRGARYSHTWAALLTNELPPNTQPRSRAVNDRPRDCSIITSRSTLGEAKYQVI